jgi:hypothetical protein
MNLIPNISSINTSSPWGITGVLNPSLLPPVLFDNYITDTLGNIQFDELGNPQIET